MALFGIMARATFKPGPDGETWFCPGGLWARPYVVPDAATEQRLYTRQLWMLRLVFGYLIVGQTLVFSLLPAVTQDAYWFLGYLAVAMLSFWAVSYLVFWGELRGLRRAPKRMTPAMICRDMANRAPTMILVLGLLTCVAFVACGAWLVLSERNLFIGWACTVFFSLLGLLWGYAVWLKVAPPPGGPGRGASGVRQSPGE